MARELHAGISFSDGFAQTVVVEVHDHRAELRHIEEREKDRSAEFWFLDELLSLDKKLLSKVTRVSVAIDNAQTLFHCFPIDSTITQVEQNEQVIWELSRLVADFRPKEYINDTHILRTHAREHYVDLLVVAVPRAFLFRLHEFLAGEDLNLATVEANFFASAHSLLTAHPELKTTQTIFAGMSNQRLDLGVVSNGRLIGYRQKKAQAAGDAIGMVKEIVKDSDVQYIFFYGPPASPDWLKDFRKAFGAKVMELNPFRSMTIASTCENFKQFNGREHKFAACIGSAIRN